MRYIYKKRYLDAFDRLHSSERNLVIKADEALRQYYDHRQAPFGLRIKKLHDNGRERTYEARVSARIRILWVEADDLVVFALLGNHEEIQRYLRSIR